MPVLLCGFPFIIPRQMKANIKVVTANKEFTPEQIAILKRVKTVLEAHDLNVLITMKVKKTVTIDKNFKLKAV